MAKRHKDSCTCKSCRETERLRQRSASSGLGTFGETVLEVGATTFAVAGSISGAGTPPTPDQLADSQQIGHTQMRDAIGDASNKRGAEEAEY